MLFNQKENLVDSGYQIQRTNTGEGYNWHADDDVSPILDTIVFPLRGYRDSGTVMSARRLFTYMFYLNDDFGGGFTQFRVGGNNNDILNVAPKQGKLICFPASWYFHHRGDVVTKGSKYVCTGWLSDHVTTFSNDTTSLSEKYRNDARSAGRKMLLQFNENTGRIEMDDDMKKENAKSDTFEGMYPKLSDLDTIDQTMHRIEVFNLSILGTIHRLESDLDESECDFLIDVLHGKDIDASAKKFDVNSRTVLKKLGAQADRLEQIKKNYNAFVPPVEVDKLRHGKDLDLL